MFQQSDLVWWQIEITHKGVTFLFSFTLKAHLRNCCQANSHKTLSTFKLLFNDSSQTEYSLLLNGMQVVGMHPRGWAWVPLPHTSIFYAKLPSMPPCYQLPITSVWCFIAVMNILICPILAIFKDGKDIFRTALPIRMLRRRILSAKPAAR